MAKILIFGDIKVKDAAITVDPQLKRIARNSDLVVANLEGPVISSAEKRSDKKGVCLANGEALCGLVDELSITVLLFGNNHILDYGELGLVESARFCSVRGIDWLGARTSDGGQCSYRNDQLKVCIYSFAHREGPVSNVIDKGVGPFALPDIEFFSSEINEMSARGYKIFCIYHGGEEYFNVPWPRRLGWSKRISDLGVSLVIGTHSHSIQPVFRIMDDRYIASGLGNTYFDDDCQRHNKLANDSIGVEYDTEDGAISILRLKADFEKHELKLLGQNILYAEPLHLPSITASWSDECRIYMTGKLNRVSYKSCTGEWWKKWLRPVYTSLLLLRRSLLSRFRNIRDLDIIFGSLPYFGRYWSKKAFLKGGEEFRF